MAKQKGAVSFKGKVGDKVYTDGKYGKQVRTAGELTQEQKKKKADLPQNRRTAALNSLASAINAAVDYYADALKPGSFYSDLGSDFRKAANDHRVLLLDEIRQNEVHSKYQFNKICPTPETELIVTKTSYKVEVEINKPAYKNGSSNCFYLQFILFVWNSDNNECRHMAESTPWIRLNDKTAKYTTVEFKRKPKDTEWLLSCRCVIGVNEVEDGWTATGMRFMGAGTHTKAGKLLLEKKKEEAEAERNKVPVREVVKEKPRLKLREKK